MRYAMLIALVLLCVIPAHGQYVKERPPSPDIWCGSSCNPPPNEEIVLCGWTCVIPDDPAAPNCTKSPAYNLGVQECTTARQKTGKNDVCAIITAKEATLGAGSSETYETCIYWNFNVLIPPRAPVPPIEDETYPYCNPDDYYCE